MTKNEQVEHQIIEDFSYGRISRRRASELLGVSERAVSRRVKKLREKGVSGIKHGNYKRTPINKIPLETKQLVVGLVKEKYFDFNVSHCLELLRQHHQVEISYMTLLKWCREEGLGKRKRRRPSKARIYRERMANEGVLLQMDGSHHKWNGKDTWCLISVIDDATSNIPVARFYGGETSWNCMALLERLIQARGIPQFIYTDNAGWAGGGGKRQNFSQVVRACEELGIKIIRANSAQAKGRIERSFKTMQDRLIPELRLHKITTQKDANRYLDQVYLPEWNKRFTVQAREEGNRYSKLRYDIDLSEILCFKYQRRINNDHSISFENRRYKLDPGKLGSLRQKHVNIHQYKDKSFRVFYGDIPIEYSEIKLPKRRRMLAER